MNGGTTPVEGVLVLVHGQTHSFDLVSSLAAANVQMCFLGL